MIGDKTRFGFNNPNAQIVSERVRTTSRSGCYDAQQKMPCHRHEWCSGRRYHPRAVLSLWCWSILPVWEAAPVQKCIGGSRRPQLGSMIRTPSQSRKCCTNRLTCRIRTHHQLCMLSVKGAYRLLTREAQQHYGLLSFNVIYKAAWRKLTCGVATTFALVKYEFTSLPGPLPCAR